MSDAMLDLSHAITARVSQLSPSIVRIDARRRGGATGTVWSADGLIVAAHHSIHRDEGIHVTLHDGREIDAALVGSDPATDLALLRVKVEGAALQPAPWDDGSDVAVGQVVLALSRPGRTVRAAMGIVSVYGDEYRTWGGGRLDRFVQSDVEPLMGFSGGPLVRAGGGVIGMNTSGILRRAAVAVPTTTVRRVVDSIVTHGRVRRGYLGVGVQFVALPEALARATGQTGGLLVASVEPGSAAADAGVTLGDVLLAFDGNALDGPRRLVELLTEQAVGRAVPLRVARGGVVQELQVTVATRA